VYVCVFGRTGSERINFSEKSKYYLSLHLISLIRAVKVACLTWLHYYFHCFSDLGNVFQDAVLFSGPAWRSRCSESLRTGSSEVRTRWGQEILFLKIVQTGYGTQPSSSNRHRFFFRQNSDIYPILLFITPGFKLSGVLPPLLYCAFMDFYKENFKF
jgi:hypothetical protein